MAKSSTCNRAQGPRLRGDGSLLCRSRCSRSKLVGFTILELSIVLAIIGFVVGGAVVLLTGALEKKQREATQKRMEVIADALYKYRRAFNRIPCPADVTLAITNSNFGVEATPMGTCTNPATNYSDTGVVQGMAPTKTLQLPDDYAFDGWGNRIVYAVTQAATATATYNSGPFVTNDITSTALDVIQVRESSGSARPGDAIYVLLSFGANGHGAWPRNGGTTRINAGSANEHELFNCSCDNTGVHGGGYNAAYIQKPPVIDSDTVVDRFDDIVLFRQRVHLRSSTE